MVSRAELEAPDVTSAMTPDRPRFLAKSAEATVPGVTPMEQELRLSRRLLRWSSLTEAWSASSSWQRLWLRFKRILSLEAEARTSPTSEDRSKTEDIDPGIGLSAGLRPDPPPEMEVETGVSLEVVTLGPRRPPKGTLPGLLVALSPGEGLRANLPEGLLVTSQLTRRPDQADRPPEALLEPPVGQILVSCAPTTQRW